MIIVGMCIVVFTSLFYHLIMKNKENAIEQIRSFSISDKPFSLSSYFDRIEKLNISLLEESENRETEPITLWLGNDGLRLNEDGTTEWIRQEPEHIQKNELCHRHGACGTFHPIEWVKDRNGNWILDPSGKYQAQNFDVKISTTNKESILEVVERKIKEIENDLKENKFANDPQAFLILMNFYRLRDNLRAMEIDEMKRQIQSTCCRSIGRYSDGTIAGL